MLCQTAPSQYHQQLEEKVSRLQGLLNWSEALEVFPSPPSHYRMRAEFRIWHEGEDTWYVMFPPENPRNPVRINACPMASEAIDGLMQPLREAILLEPVLREKLYQVDFLSTLSGQMLVTLIYHKKLDGIWQACAQVLREHLPIDHVIGRSRKQKVVLDQDFVIEQLTVGGRMLRYQQIENSFTQPNGAVAVLMLQWAQAQAVKIGGDDLLELYGGNGNFSIALSDLFERVLMTEISRTSIRSARFNVALNQVENVEVVQAAAEDVSRALSEQADCLKQVDLSAYEFSTLLVDPPRAGLDALTRSIAQRFEWVIYISCNPETLARDVAALAETHKVEAVALFDQFPYTQHIESGVLLRRVK